MFRLNFKAGVATASKNSVENYYMIGLADDRYDYKNYLLFQRPIKLGRYKGGRRRAANGLYAPSVGDVCRSGRKAVKITRAYRF